MFIWLDQSRSILRVAIDALDLDSSRERACAVSAAKQTVGRAAGFIGKNAIQLHGGIGLTEEYKIGRYFQALVTFEGLFGDEHFHLDRFANLTGRMVKERS